jgi:flagellar basal body P-ring formation protein FlgA
MRFRSFYRIFFFKEMTLQSKQIMRLCWLTCISTLWLCQNANAQASFESIEGIRSKVAQFLTDEYVQSQAIKVEVKVGSLDNRLRLVKCDQNLAMVSKDTSLSGGNINVQVECKGSSTWTILVPTQAKVFRSVAVASRNLQRGEVIHANDLTSDVKNAGDLRLGFTLTTEALIGKEVKYTINKGEAFRNSALDTPLVIKRGDTVTMEAAVGGISVRTNATAISDGRIGQQIRVKNIQSARVVNAKVVSAGKVQSIM